MGKKLLFALLGLWSVSVWAADPWCSARGSQAFSFAWEPKKNAEPTLGSVKIKSASSGKTVQVLNNVENYHADSDSLGVRDFNNDGCGDLVVVSSVAGIGNESDTIFLYNPKSKRFILNRALSEIGGLDIDARDKNCVTGFWKGGADDFYSAKYCWRGEKLVLKSDYSTSPLMGENDTLKCYQHVVTEYRAGKKKVKKSCNQKL